MNRIISLMGRGNSGKSTTIGMLPAILITNGYTQIPGMYINQGADFSDIFIKNQLKVGVTSAGDTYDLVLQRLTRLVNAGCNVCICACRTSGGTHIAIHSFVGYSYHFEQKTYAANTASQILANTIDADKLFSLL